MYCDTILISFAPVWSYSDRDKWVNTNDLSLSITWAGEVVLELLIFFRYMFFPIPYRIYWFSWFALFHFVLW